MATKKNAGRQEVISAVLTLDAADLDANGVVGAVDLPEGATVVSGLVNVVTAVAGAGAGATVALSGGGVTLAATDVDAGTSSNTVTVDGSVVGSGGTTVNVTLAGGTGAATAGKVNVIIDYVVEGRAAFSEG